MSLRSHVTVVVDGPMRVEHHPNFSAIYWEGVLAAQVLVGTKEQREAMPVDVYHRLCTWAARFD